MTTFKTPGPPKPIIDESTLEWTEEHAACLRAFCAGQIPKITSGDITDIVEQMDQPIKAQTIGAYLNYNANVRPTIQATRLNAIMEALRSITGDTKLSREDVFGIGEAGK